MASVLDREAIVAPKTFNRWLIPAAALAIHLCIGQVYAFSVFKIPLMSRFDVGEVSVGWIFSVAIAMLGLSAAFGGTWVEKAGPRKSMVVAGTAWVLGFFIAALGIATGQLWLVYFGYGFIGGVGLVMSGFDIVAQTASALSHALMWLFGPDTETEDLATSLVHTFMTQAISYGVIIVPVAYMIRVAHADCPPVGMDPTGVTEAPM